LKPERLAKKLNIGLIINPVAGVGGPAGFKGSDGPELYEVASNMGYKSIAHERVSRALSVLLARVEDFKLVTVSGKMGAELCRQLSGSHPQLEFDVCYDTGIEGSNTEVFHTFEAVKHLRALGLDIILFAGGDGTARNVLDALGLQADQLVLGIPGGVKMHSGVFAVSPEAAGIVLQQLIEGELVSAVQGEVRDIDEVALRSGKVNSQYYGELSIPEQHQYVQAVKQGGLEVEGLVLDEIASFVIEQMDPSVTYIIGAGTTTAAIMEKLKLPNTLLGVDVIDEGRVVLADASEQELYQYIDKKQMSQGAKVELPITKLLLSPIGGQGHLFGRGNQQLSARILSLIGLSNFIVMATKSKLEALAAKEHSPASNNSSIGLESSETPSKTKGIRLLVDTGDLSFDRSLCGLIQVVTGYEDAVICRLALN
jgi:predicted polyphosphate/ATP-dependent NAD kinase